MRPVTISNTATGFSEPAVTDIYLSNALYSVQLTVSGTNTSDVQYTINDPFGEYATSFSANATWWTLTSFSGATATTVSNLSYPVRAFRLNTTAYTDGYAELLVVQQGVM